MTAVNCEEPRQSVVNPKQSPAWLRGVWIDVFLIMVLWCAAELVINPSGNFPLNDDWSWSIAVKRLLAGEGFHPTFWTGATLLTHTLWGALFCGLFGFSFTTLRFATLTASVLAIVITYLLVRRLTPHRWAAIFVALLLAFNPIYFVLSNTYMMDVTYIAFMMPALAAYLEALRTKSAAWTAAGTLLSIVAMLNRQIGLFIPLGFGLAAIARELSGRSGQRSDPKGKSRARWTNLFNGLTVRVLFRAMAPTLICAGILIGFERWMKATGRLPGLYNAPVDYFSAWIHHPLATLIKDGQSAVRAVLYIGLFTAPLLLVTAPPSGPRKIPLFWTRVIPTMFAVATLLGLLFSRQLMPLAQNVLAPSGLGPVFFGEYRPSPLPVSFWLVLTLVSVLSGAVLLSRLLALLLHMLQDGARPSQNDASAVQLFFLLQGAVSIAPLLLTYYLDRYLVPIALLLGLAFATLPRTGHRGVSRPPLLLGFGALAAMIIFSVTATHDYFALHQARWRLLERCMAERHIDPSQIEGGFEFDNWFAPGSFDQRTAAKHGDYVVAKSPANRLGLVDQEQFGLWLPPKKEVMFLIRKQP